MGGREEGRAPKEARHAKQTQAPEEYSRRIRTLIEHCGKLMTFHAVYGRRWE